MKLEFAEDSEVAIFKHSVHFLHAMADELLVWKQKTKITILRLQLAYIFILSLG